MATIEGVGSARPYDANRHGSGTILLHDAASALTLPEDSLALDVSTARPRRLGVLLIEDDDDDALIVEDLLAESSLAVRLGRGRTLEEGLAQLPDAVDCVLLDLRLPDVVGMDAVTRLRAEAPWIAVVVLTGFDDEAAGEAAVEAGAQDYLVKGKVDSGLLARAIRYAVSRRHAEDVQQQLRVAEIRADENARLERGLVPHPIIDDASLWIASSYLPGRRRALLGGDFYDAVQTADGCLHLLVGDVSGRGPDEAALGAALRIAWRALTLSDAAGDVVLGTLQRMIEHERQVPGAFATLCTLEISDDHRSLCMRRAGHPSPVVIDGGSISSLPLDGGGPPIGMFTSPEWPMSRYDLPEGWVVMLYTDGVIEGGDGHSGQLGEVGLRRLIGEHVGREHHWQHDPHRLLRHVIARTTELNGEELRDDMAMIVVGCRH
jgi:serine phosphatase RsbU (regulator of sigma subunit)